MTGYRGLTGPGQDIESAVVVVELDSARMIANATVSDFQLRDRAGKEQPLTHAVSVEIFNRLHVPTEGAAAYYLNPGGTTPWNGTLPAGPIRLRVRYGFSADPAEDFTHFLIKIGPYVIEGPVEGTWPS